MTSDAAITTWPIPPAAAVPASRVLLFGGSFDPPHIGHLAMGLGARDSLGPDAWLVFVPAARSPFKSTGPVAPGEDRVAMLDAACADARAARVAVWSDEIDRADATGSPSYWVRTIERARHAMGATPVDRPWFLLGADQAATFHLWREPRRILEMASPIVALRDSADSADALMSAMPGGVWNDAELARWRSATLSLPLVAASATEARTLLQAAPSGLADDRLDRLLSPSVRALISRRHLYEERVS